MLGELPEETQVVENEEFFTPDREAVVKVVNAVNQLLAEEEYASMRVLDILTALEALSAFIKDTIGVAGMTEIIEEGADV